MFVDSSHQTYQFEKTQPLLTTTGFEHTSHIPVTFTLPLYFHPYPSLPSSLYPSTFTPTPLFPLLYIVQQVYFSNFYVSILCFLIHHIRHTNLKKTHYWQQQGSNTHPVTFTPTPLLSPLPLSSLFSRSKRTDREVLILPLTNRCGQVGVPGSFFSITERPMWCGCQNPPRPPHRDVR